MLSAIPTVAYTLDRMREMSADGIALGRAGATVVHLGMQSWHSNDIAAILAAYAGLSQFDARLAKLGAHIPRAINSSIRSKMTPSRHIRPLKALAKWVHASRGALCRYT
jgi:hypothetical protein